MNNLTANRAIMFNLNTFAIEDEFPRFMYLWPGYQQNYFLRWPAFN